MQIADTGAMLSVRATAEVVNKYLSGKLDLAAHNAPELCVVSGPDKDIDELVIILGKDDIPCSRLHTSHAFHSAMMEAAIAPTEEILNTISLEPPAIPIMSTVDGAWLSDESAVSPRYWGRNLRDTVRFAEAINKLLIDGRVLFLEVGPGQTLSTLAKQCAVDFDGVKSVASLPHINDEATDTESLLAAYGKLWSIGARVKWDKLRSAPGRRVPLPTYPFERKRHWVDPGKFEDRISSAVGQPEARASGEKGSSLQLVERQMAIMASHMQILKKTKLKPK
jgi:acyl transferase domain-containing protein